MGSVLFPQNLRELGTQVFDFFFHVGCPDWLHFRFDDVRLQDLVEASVDELRIAEFYLLLASFLALLFVLVVWGQPDVEPLFVLRRGDSAH